MTKEEFVGIGLHNSEMKEQRYKWLSLGLITGFVFCATVFTLGWQYGVESLR